MAGKASKEELRREIRELRLVGIQMANYCFNMGQSQRTNEQKLMYEMSQSWDRIKRAEARDGG